MVSLFDVTFVVVDVETTGGSPSADLITEVGALKIQGGEVLGTFETLVNPGVAMPPEISALTGITETMLTPAPTIEQVLPCFLEFLRDAVLVGHNLRFDCAFLDAALERGSYPAMPNHRIDTLKMARRLVKDEVPNLRLATLAAHLHATVDPVHRAFPDAAATTDVFHALLERAGTYDVFTLDDLDALTARKKARRRAGPVLVGVHARGSATRWSRRVRSTGASSGAR
jgi:DNA polymerase-3 subunit epsilon